MNKDISLYDVRNLALNLESTAPVSKARNDEATTNIVKCKYQNKTYKQKTIESEYKAVGSSRKTCFRYDKPNHITE